MENLDLISTETLLTEVFNRFDGAVMMGVQTKTRTNQSTFYNRWTGNHAICIGLTELLREIIKDDYKKGK